MRSSRYPLEYCPDKTQGYKFTTVPGKVWKLHFKEFALAPGSRIDIYAGSETDHPLLTTFDRSSTVTGDFVIASNYMIIRFVAGADTDTGFEIEVTSEGIKNMHNINAKGLLQFLFLKI